MNIILLEKIGRLGNLGDQVKVRSGYARNYLFPKSKAVPATKESIAKFEARRAELEKEALKVLAAAQTRATALAGLKVDLVARASDEGKLFGSFGIKDIVDAITKMGIDIHKSEIRLPNGVLRHVGEYDILVQLHADVSATIKVVVTPEA